MLGAEVVPAAVFLAIVLRVPESPRWLITRRQDDAAARKILTLVNPETVDDVIEDIRRAQDEFTDNHLSSGDYTRPVPLVFLMPETRGRTLEALAGDLSRHG